MPFSNLNLWVTICYITKSNYLVFSLSYYTNFKELWHITFKLFTKFQYCNAGVVKLTDQIIK